MGFLGKLFDLFSESGGRSTPSRAVTSFQARQEKMARAGSVEGSHYTQHVDRVRELKRAKRHAEAVDLLLRLVDATEAEARAAGAGWGVAPWYYEQLAIIYRKEKRFEDEVGILKRYQAQTKAPGAKPGKLATRLIKAEELLERERAPDG